MRMSIQARTVAFTIFVCRTSAADRLAAASAGLADRVFTSPIVLVRRSSPSLFNLGAKSSHSGSRLRPSRLLCTRGVRGLILLVVAAHAAGLRRRSGRLRVLALRRAAASLCGWLAVPATEAVALANSVDGHRAMPASWRRSPRRARLEALCFAVHAAAPRRRCLWRG